MIIVAIKNRFLFFIFLVVFFSCKKEEKQIININYSENKNNVIKQVSQKITLPLNINFFEIKDSRISVPITKWCEIAPDGFIIFNLILEKNHYLIKTKYKSCNQAINFTLSDEVNKKVTLLIEQVYYPFDDSLVFVKNHNKFELKKAFTTEYNEKEYKNYIREKKIKYKEGFIELE
jgi:hypothetical protein